MHRDRGRVGPDSVGVAAYEGPLVRVRLTLSRTLWRIGPAWSVLAGACVAGWAPVDTGAILRLVAAVVLGDLAWGSLRQMIPRAPAGLRLPEISPAFLPYARPGAPLARFLSYLGGGVDLPAATAWQSLAVSAVLVVVLSLLVGPAALALSAGVLLLVTLAWLLVVNRGSYPAMSYALLDVAAPWLLGMSTAGLGALTSGGLARVLALLAGFTVLQWGVQRSGQGCVNAPVGVWVGQVAVLLALIAAQQVWACAIVAALFGPPSWWLLGRGEAGLMRSLPWWWGALGVAVLTFGQAIHTF